MDREISLDIQDFCNEYGKNEGERARTYWLFLENQFNLTKEDGEIVWNGDKIAGFQPYQSMESVSTTITVGEN